ncbi:hypothetical protein NECAME_14814 [Necator americanus]|uniref:Uncharacterized protein n=1 Tax=Necator americanus TaxID=51031 RepID=W2SNT3_NECAM|nr:hypothetical protein NECAME_14814 [Necator americanus]ETN70357.1 hypothetical protein NECAME_14814 [Necator americanus]
MLANNLCPSEEAAPNYAQFQVIKPTCEAFQEWAPAATAPVQYPQAQQFPFLFPQSEWSYPAHLQLQQPGMLQPHEMKLLSTTKHRKKWNYTDNAAHKHMYIYCAYFLFRENF